MNSAIRMFALLVAIAGLAAASFAPATSQPLSKHASMAANGPGPRPTRSSALLVGWHLHCADGVESLISLGALLH